MDSISEQIKASAADLARAAAAPRLALSRVGACSLPSDCYSMWVKRVEKLQQPLLSTERLLTIRLEAFSIAGSLAKEASDMGLGETAVRFAGQRMEFPLARHLALASYLTTTWTIYDRLANVCGRLMGTDSVGDAEGSRSNPKLCEHFLTGREDKDKNKLVHGFSLSKVLPAYAWPAKASYLIRNWLVHEGSELDGIPLFAGDAPSDVFTLRDRAMSRIATDLTNENTRPQECCLAKDATCPWYDKEMLTILAKYHVEIDTMFAALVKWSVDCFIGQITVFTQRDRLVLTDAVSCNGAPS